MVAHGGLPPVCYEILQGRAGEQTPSQTRVSLGQADPHENSGVWKQMQSTAVEIGVQTVGIETLVTEADLEFDLEWDPAVGSETTGLSCGSSGVGDGSASGSAAAECSMEQRESASETGQVGEQGGQQQTKNSSELLPSHTHMPDSDADAGDSLLCESNGRSGVGCSWRC